MRPHRGKAHFDSGSMTDRKDYLGGGTSHEFNLLILVKRSWRATARRFFFFVLFIHPLQRDVHPRNNLTYPPFSVFRTAAFLKFNYFENIIFTKQ